LIRFGLVEEGIRFFSSTELAMPMVVLAGSWKYISFIALVLLARLQSIDDSLYEQAKVSGAGRLRMFRDVTLPNLRAAILVVVLLRLIWMFNKFDLIYLFTYGGPLNATETLPLYAFEVTFGNLNLGMGAATSMVMFAILSVFAIIYFIVFKPSQEIAAQES
jgi:multiple sugar transport system permease protein